MTPTFGCATNSVYTYTHQKDSTMPDELDELLAFDPLDAAEQITGQSYKTDEETMSLGFGMALRHGRMLNDALIAAGDTVLHNQLDRYINIIEKRLGFERVLDIPFVGDVQEHLYVYAHRDGMLLVFDTFDGLRVNGGHLYYCITPKSDEIPAGEIPKDMWKITSSGGWRQMPDGTMVWAGDHDCREAICRKIDNIRQVCNFLPVWPDGHTMLLWLLHYQDTKNDDYDYKQITAERIAMMPEWVQRMINIPAVV